jgi:hypothetical protein
VPGAAHHGGNEVSEPTRVMAGERGMIPWIERADSVRVPGPSILVNVSLVGILNNIHL